MVKRQETIAQATERSIEAAQSSKQLTDLDAGAVATLRGLAKTVDYLIMNDGMSPSGRFDNVTVPTYLKFCESLGLTPAGRKAIGEKKQEGTRGTLHLLRTQHQGGSKQA